MDVVISVMGTYGDIVPSVAVARQLEKKGANVLFLCNDYFSTFIKKQGINCESVGTKEEYEAGINAGFGHRQKANKNLLLKTIAPSIKRQFQVVESLQKRSSNLKIITPGPTNGAFMAGEKFGLDIIKLLFSPLYTSQYFEKIKLFHTYHRFGFEMRFLNSARKSVGLKEIQHFSHTLERERLAIGLYPEWFIGSSGMSHPSVTTTAFSTYQPESTDRAGFVEFIKKYGPPIIFYSGSVINPPKMFFEESFRICEKLGLPGVFLCEENSSFVKQLPKHIYITPSIDMNFALQHSRLIVHPGGIGTIVQAMLSGVPQLIVPRVNDQFYNASRAAAFGSAGFVMPHQYRAGHPINVIRNITNTENLKLMRQELSIEMKNQNGCDMAAELIFGLN